MKRRLLVGIASLLGAAMMVGRAHAAYSLPFGQDHAERRASRAMPATPDRAARAHAWDATLEARSARLGSLRLIELMYVYTHRSSPTGTVVPLPLRSDEDDA